MPNAFGMWTVEESPGPNHSSPSAVGSPGEEALFTLTASPAASPAASTEKHEEVEESGWMPPADASPAALPAVSTEKHEEEEESGWMPPVDAIMGGA